MMSKNTIKISACTVFALLAFAGNSVLCRLALGGNAIDAASFTIIRLLSGIAVLMVLVAMTKRPKKSQSRGSWLAACLLFVYALAFSYGYLSLDTGTGALILFAAVQITMIAVGIVSGNRLHVAEWLGLFIAFSGFVYLILPSVTTPSLMGFLLMTLSGIAWGGYTLAGRSSTQPLADTAYNFLRTSPFVLILLVFTLQSAQVTQQGVLLAIVSGAIASGAGYAVWYFALRGLSVTQAAVVQLFVPIIAAMGGVLVTDESITLRLTESSALVLGGILMVILGRHYFVSRAVVSPATQDRVRGRNY
ncbi:DMT family transporter [Marinobacter sp.]|uniref:DMT family transporter n=1 Tax=Marinobacter sp. TaxID=50741 RepID=UPI002B2776B2|nr:DMT family transporter [Marinobacter sp.]